MMILFKSRVSQRFLFLPLFLLVFSFSLFPQTRPPDALQEYRNGNYLRSVQICRDELSANPFNLESHVVICWSLIRLGRYAEALEYANNGRRISRYDVRITNILGEIAYFQGRNNEAIQYFQEYINLAPSGSQVNTAYYYLGEIYIRLGRFHHADVALSTALHRVPENALWWSRLAYARENTGDLQRAVSAYDRALSLNPQLTDARRGLERVRQALPN